ncbi:MAG: hypothetical protein JXR23_07190 [Pontiellaceae bacterium]|nr:hypothetical protein [Pontiellaceae bacterium]
MQGIGSLRALRSWRLISISYYRDKKAEYAPNPPHFTIAEHDYLTVRYHRNMDIHTERLWIKRIATSPTHLQNVFLLNLTGNYDSPLIKR